MLFISVNYFCIILCCIIFRHISITHNKTLGKVTDYYTINKELKP